MNSETQSPEEELDAHCVGLFPDFARLYEREKLKPGQYALYHEREELFCGYSFEALTVERASEARVFDSRYLFHTCWQWEIWWDALPVAECARVIHQWKAA